MSATTTAPRPLPQPRHASRIPAHLTPEQVDRIRLAAYLLPQVVQPIDYQMEQSAEADAHLDGLGLILLQKAVPGQRPSRWIDPALMTEALQHLNVVGSGQSVRALMLERATTLDAQGVARRGDAWQREARQGVQLRAQGWRLTVTHHQPVPAQAVWDFFRTGDKPALIKALSTLPDYPHAEALTAHLERLVNRSAELNLWQIGSLLPALQSECATAQPLDSLMTACTRAQDRWEHRVNEQDTMEGLSSELAFQGYPDSFPQTRRLQRKVTLFVGPPNSGKTYQAFERLAKAKAGAYLAPLRLLALEGRDRLAARGVPCSLRTGEESVPADGARVVSSTIEMVDTNKPIEVAVIDEAQMIFDHSRGWAWTQAIVAVPAEELLIICSDYAVEALRNLLGLCGEECTVQRFERKQHVELLPQPVSLHSLKKGDAVVAFSRRDVLMLRDQAAANGQVVSVIYGALPPEVRRREAERFATGESHVLVATDAIGMGLNLPVRRVLFSTMTKFDGQGDRPLTESEVHQIAGRAGRFGLHEEGFCGVLKEAEPTALRTLKALLPKVPKAPRDFKAPVAPNWWHIDTIASRLGKSRLRDVLMVFVEQLQLDNAHFAVAELDQMLDLAGQLDQVAGHLPLRQRFVYAQAPVDTRTDAQVKQFLEWAGHHARSGQAGAAWFLNDVDEHSRLERMEQTLRTCTLWLWLDLRFPGIYGQVDEVVDLRARLNDGIERQLKAKKPLWQARGGRRG
jgi:ATP-dependent RNA helicase SUPV3L1/SUV3